MICIVGCLHGNELLGKEVIEILRHKVNAKFIIANEDAMLQNKRFIETDLNRSFPGDRNGSKEERLAHELLRELHDVDFVIDIHSTTAETEGFVIAVDERARKLIDAVPLQKVVFMPSAFASGRSLIDHVNGVSLEFNKNTKADSVADIIFQTLVNFENNVVRKKEEFIGKTMLLGNNVYHNFKQIPEQPKFYAVLSGEDAYKGISCILCEKM